MTDEDVSEFAELLHIVCEEYVDIGGEISSSINIFQCPLGVLVNIHRPVCLDAADILKISSENLYDFILGFDGNCYCSKPSDDRFFNLGQQFKEKYP